LYNPKKVELFDRTRYSRNTRLYYKKLSIELYGLEPINWMTRNVMSNYLRNMGYSVSGYSMLESYVHVPHYDSLAVLLAINQGTVRR